jgi:uncharacterized protein YbaP (TraB family)
MRSILAGLILLISAAGISGQTPVGPVRSEPAILYRISGNKLTKPSYVFGTIHLVCPADMFRSETLNGYLGQTQQLMLELNLKDPEVMQQVAKASVLPDGKTVKDYLKPGEYAKIDAVFKDYVGMSYEPLKAIKPSLVTVLLFRSPKVIGCDRATAYDSVLADAAVSKGLPIYGLETVQDEMSAIDSQSIEKQVSDLSKTAADPEAAIGSFKRLYRAYLDQNSDDLYTLASNAGAANADLMSRLLRIRNAAWIPVIEKNITAKPTFIGVGSAHLGGDEGIIKLLRAKGYTLTPIRL